MAASATLALKAGVWFRRGRLLIVSTDSLGTACPLSGRTSTYRPVQISAAGSNILLAEHIGRALVVGSEPADRLDVDVPGPLGKAGKPHVVDHTLTQRGHGCSPFGFKRQDLCPGTDQIPQHAVPNDYAFYGEAVQSNRCGSVEMRLDDVKTEG